MLILIKDYSYKKNLEKEFLLLKEQCTGFQPSNIRSHGN